MAIPFGRENFCTRNYWTLNFTHLGLLSIPIGFLIIFGTKCWVSFQDRPKEKENHILCLKGKEKTSLVQDLNPIQKAKRRPRRTCLSIEWHKSRKTRWKGLNCWKYKNFRGLSWCQFYLKNSQMSNLLKKNLKRKEERIARYQKRKYWEWRKKRKKEKDFWCLLGSFRWECNLILS